MGPNNNVAFLGQREVFQLLDKYFQQKMNQDPNNNARKGIRSGKELVKFKCQDCYMIFFSIDDLKKHEKEHKSEENDFMNEL